MKCLCEVLDADFAATNKSRGSKTCGACLVYALIVVTVLVGLPIVIIVQIEKI